MAGSLATWSIDWQKDIRFSKRYTADLIEKACRMDYQLNCAYCRGTLKVIAGPHCKAKPHGGGDARWHITLQPSNDRVCWHVILDNTVTRPVKISKREFLWERF